MPKESTKKEKRSDAFKETIMEILYYGVLILIFGSVLMTRRKMGDGPKMFMGYSAFVVLSGSMEEEIPKGSLVITKQIDSSQLKEGDDITYMVDETTSITHRIVRIEENFQNTGERAFQTKGIQNSMPDEKLVAAVNVVGKVIFHSLILGKVASFVQANWPLLIFFMVMLTLFIKVIKYILRNELFSGDEQ